MRGTGNATPPCHLKGDIISTNGGGVKGRVCSLWMIAEVRGAVVVWQSELFEGLAVDTPGETLASL